MVNWKVFFTGFLVLFIDRVTKNIFFEDSVRNYGAAFSLLQGLNVLFIIVAIAVICLIIYYSNKIRNVISGYITRLVKKNKQSEETV